MRERLPRSSTMPLCAILLVAMAMASTIAASAQTRGYIVIHTFHGSDGSGPLAPLTFDNEGNLYGTTTNGGDLNCNSPGGCGVVFRLRANGEFAVLHSFSGGSDGQNPEAGVISGAGKTLYGTTQGGGSGCPPSACGTVYQIAPNGEETVLYAFKGGPSDGVGPTGSLFQDANQNLFGTTAAGGMQGVFGTAFELTPSGEETVLHLFTNFFESTPDGSIPGAGFTSDQAGNLYSTTQTGGSNNSNCNGVGCGTVFELTPSGASWNESVVYSFLGGTDGIQPAGNLVKDTSGDLYGVTVGGGSTNCGSFGCGIIFKLTPAPSGGWTESVLYTFTGAADGANPRSLVADSRGNLYGAATSGGRNNHGTLFSLSAGGHFAVLHSFTGGPDGATPQVGLVVDRPQTIVVGATAGGGAPNCGSIGCGVVFAYAP